MHPILLSLGPITIHSYGFLVAIGFLCAVATGSKLAQREKVNPQFVVDLYFWLLIIGLIGARALHVFTTWENYRDDWMSVFYLWEGGLTFYGAMLTGLPLIFIYCHRAKVSPWKIADIMIPGVVVAHAVGRLGCLMAGCCYGLPTTLPWGIRLGSSLVAPHLRDIPLHPTQIYESTALFVIYLGLLKLHKKKQFDGQIILSYLVVYGVIRSVIEVFRADIDRGFVIGDWYSTSQFISTIGVTAGIVLLFIRAKGAKIKL